MANVRAFRSGNWSDTNPATSPWGTGGVLYAPAANDDVFSNSFTIHVDTNVTVTSITNASTTSRLWKDGATTTATGGGTFNLLNGITFDVSSTIMGSAGVPNHNAVTLPGSNSGVVMCPYIAPGSTTNAHCINNLGTGILTFVGNSFNPFGNGCNAIRNESNGTINIIGNITSNSQYNAVNTINVAGGIITVTGNVLSSSSIGIDNASAGVTIVIGNVESSSSFTDDYGIRTNSTGTTIVVGNLLATGNSPAFFSSNANATNKISGNIINHPNGTAAIYAARYRVDPIPQNSFIQYSNVNQFSTDSLSAFSMPPVSAVRFGTPFANNTLVGTCIVPSASSVTANVAVDNTIGIAITNIQSAYDTLTTPLTALTGINTIGSKIKNISTTDVVGNIFASFTNG